MALYAQSYAQMIKYVYDSVYIFNIHMVDKSRKANNQY